jgi:hypothetical protein
MDLPMDRFDFVSGRALPGPGISRIFYNTFDNGKLQKTQNYHILKF